MKLIDADKLLRILDCEIEQALERKEHHTFYVLSYLKGFIEKMEGTEDKA